MRQVGTLGGLATFAGQATEIVVNRFEDIGSTRYFSTVDLVWDAVDSGDVDCAVLTSETTHTGLGEIAAKMLDPERPFYVDGEVITPYHCTLLGKPGASLDQLRLVLGHGSLVQCRSYFAEELPGVEVRIHHQNSLAAAAEVLEGDGTTAVVGTRLSGEQHRLSVLAPDVDRGSQGAWWLLSRELHVARRPDVLVAAARSEDHGVVRRVLDSMNTFGFALRSMAAINEGALFGDAYLMVFTGEPLAVPAGRVLAEVPDTWLVGAFESTGTRSVPGAT
jgi:prephenate dehydratase